MPTIIGSCEEINESLSRIFNHNDPEGEFDGLSIIEASIKYKGFSKAAELAADNKPVLIWTTDPMEFSLNYEGQLVHVALAYPWVKVVGLPSPASISELFEAGRDAMAGKGTRNSFIIEAARIGIPKEVIGTLKHDLRYLECSNFNPDDPRYPWWIKHATQLFGQDSNESLATKVREAKLEEVVAPLAGQQFSVMCVDLEGTLVDRSGKVREEILDLAIRTAEERMLPPTIWTGGDFNKAEELLRGFRMQGLLPLWPLVSKWIFRDTSVSVMIDDLDQSSLKAEYGIESKVFIQA